MARNRPTRLIQRVLYRPVSGLVSERPLDASSNAFPWLKPQWLCVARRNSPTVAGAVPDLLQMMLTGFPFICAAIRWHRTFKE
jgi:hypothetical protein